jgi:glycine oxidase
MGAWSEAAGEWLHSAIPVQPQKGQNLRLHWSGEPFRYLMGQVDWGHLIQRGDGLLSTGSTEEQGLGRDTTPTTAARDYLVEQALRLMPGLEVAEVVEQFAGPRPQSPDDLPIMGPIDTLSGVYLNAGHGHSGIVLAAASARHVAELVLTGSSSVLPVEPYLAARFRPLGGS